MHFSQQTECLVQESCTSWIYNVEHLATKCEQVLNITVCFHAVKLSKLCIIKAEIGSTIKYANEIKQIWYH